MKGTRPLETTRSAESQHVSLARLKSALSSNNFMVFSYFTPTYTTVLVGVKRCVT